jgi:hypothetical protein
VSECWLLLDEVRIAVLKNQEATKWPLPVLRQIREKSSFLTRHKFEKSAYGTVMEDKIKLFTAVNKITEPGVLQVMINFLCRNSP